MKEILSSFERISLEEMKSVRLMNRIDTKYVTTIPVLVKLLELARADYRVQELDGMLNMPYHTMYFDTHDFDMYMQHLHGHKTRQKIRVRTYETSELSFLEIKNKNNKGRTKKKRIQYTSFDAAESVDFIGTYLRYNYDDLQRSLENRFKRITLVNRNMTERLTIDTDLRFNNPNTGAVRTLDGFVVIELKRDGNTDSPVLRMLRDLRIQPARFSKYCMGLAFTDSELKNNRFKPRMRMVTKLCNVKDLEIKQFYI